MGTSHFSWWLAPLGAERGHFQRAAPTMPLTALLFLQGGFDRAGSGGEGCWGPWVAWGRREGDTRTPGCAGSQPHGCALLLQAPQSPGSHPTNPFPEMLLAFGGGCISPSPSSACPAIPQSALQLLKSALSRGGSRSCANKNNFPASARAESGSAGTRSEGWRLPGACSCQEGSRFPCVIGCLGDVAPRGGISRDSSPARSSRTGAGAMQLIIE